MNGATRPMKGASLNALDHSLCTLHAASSRAQSRSRRPLVVTAGKRPPPPPRKRPDDGGGREVPKWRVRSNHGKSYESKSRRRGRPAWERSPNDTPLRDGNRDRVIGLLTERAIKTLIYYLSETNMNVMYWLSMFYKEHPIPRDGHWDDVSGETFLRKLLSMPIEHAQAPMGKHQLHTLARGCGVDPRNLAQRIMDIRTQIAKEMTKDLQEISQENSALMRESLSISFNLDNIVAHPTDGA